MIRVVLLALVLAVAWGGDPGGPPGAVVHELPGFSLRSAAGEGPTRELAAELTRARSALVPWLSANLRPLPDRLPPLPVLFFADRRDFQTYARTHAAAVATAHADGFYAGDGTPGGGKLVLFRDGGRELSTARHELAHYLLDQLLPARRGQPVWFNEGLAVCIEEAWIDPGQVRLPHIPMQRHELLRALAADGGTPLTSITALGADAWLERAGTDRPAADRQYAASYGAVLYLLNRHPERYWRFLRALAEGTGHDQAFAAAFDGIPDGLDTAWRRWVARDAWEAARRADGRASAAHAVEYGHAWLPEHLPPGDPIEAARGLAAAGRGFAGVAGYELDAAAAWLAAARAQARLRPAAAGEAAETAAALFAKRGHLAGQAEALLAACRAWGDDDGRGDWERAAALGRVAVQLAEAVGPDHLRAAAYTAYASCFIPGRAGRAPDGGDARTEAESALQRARALHRAASDVDREASVVLLTAQVLAPPDGSPGDWARCLALAGEAAALWRTIPDQSTARADLARAAAVAAGLHRPDRNPGGDWRRVRAELDREAALLAADDHRRRLRNRLDLGSCALGLDDPATAAAAFAAAETYALALNDDALAGYAAYQIGWSLQTTDPAAAAAAFLRAAPRYRAANRPQQEAMAVGQAAQLAAKAGAAAAEVAALFLQAAELDRVRGDTARQAYNTYQRAWYSEPSRQPGADPAVVAEWYAEAAELWAAHDPARTVQARTQRARLLTPVKGAAAGWAEAARTWAEVAAALTTLPDADRRQAERGSALHQQAWCLIAGDGRRHTATSRRLFAEAVRLQREGGDPDGARASASWIGDGGP